MIIVAFIVSLVLIVLAAVILPMALVTAGRGLRGRFDRHVRLARWTLPLWMYVSVTGVVVGVVVSSTFSSPY